MSETLKAHEAKQLVNESKDLFDSYVVVIDNKIREEAKLGETSVAISMVLGRRFSRCEPTYILDVKPEASNVKLVDRIIAHYRINGFGASYSMVDQKSYVPRGLQDDDGKGVEYRNWAIIITW